MAVFLALDVEFLECLYNQSIIRKIKQNYEKLHCWKAMQLSLSTRYLLKKGYKNLLHFKKD